MGIVQKADFDISGKMSCPSKVHELLKPKTIMASIQDRKLFQNFI